MMAPSRRLVTSVSLLAVVILMLAVWSLRSGAVTLDFAQVFNALLGSAPAQCHPGGHRVATAARGDGDSGGRGRSASAGAIFQSLMRNPLGSPDVMGLNTGRLERRAGGDGAVCQHLTASRSPR